MRLENERNSLLKEKTSSRQWRNMHQMQVQRSCKSKLFKFMIYFLRSFLCFKQYFNCWCFKKRFNSINFFHLLTVKAMKAIAKYKIQWVNSINQLSVKLNALMMSENLNSLMTLFILRIKIKSSCSSFIET